MAQKYSEQILFLIDVNKRTNKNEIDSTATHKQHQQSVRWRRNSRQVKMDEHSTRKMFRSYEEIDINGTNMTILKASRIFSYGELKRTKLTTNSLFKPI